MVRAVSFFKAPQVLIWNPEFSPKTTIMKTIDLRHFEGWKTFIHLKFICVEINENQPNEKSKVFILSLLLARESVTITCILAETRRQAEE